MFQHMKDQPFVTATAGAALIHSWWALSTLFAGNAPTAPELTAGVIPWLGFVGSWLYWAVPGLMIAFALDVGQLATAHKIQSGQVDNVFQKRALALTFVIFAAATYYLQWLYMAHHMPALTISEGVQNTAFVVGLRDAALWIIPLLLPLSTLLYTLSGKTMKDEAQSNVNDMQVKADAIISSLRIDTKRDEQPVLWIGDIEPKKLKSGDTEKKTTTSTAVLKKKAIEMIEAGMAKAEVARELGKNPSTIYRWMKAQ